MLVNSTGPRLRIFISFNYVFPTLLIYLTQLYSTHAFSWDSPALRYILKVESIKQKEAVPIEQILSNSLIQKNYDNSKLSLISWTADPKSQSRSASFPVSLKRYSFTAIQDTSRAIAEKLRSNTTHSLFSASYLLNEKVIGASILSRFIPTSFHEIKSEKKAPFLNTEVTTLITDFSKLRIINADTHRYISFKEWSENLKSIFEETQSNHPLIILTGDFSINNKQREVHLFKTAERLNLRRITFNKDQRCQHGKLIHNYIFTRGFHLRSAETIPLEGLKHHAIEVVLEPVAN